MKWYIGIFFCNFLRFFNSIIHFAHDSQVQNGSLNHYKRFLWRKGCLGSLKKLHIRAACCLLFQSKQLGLKIGLKTIFNEGSNHLKHLVLLLIMGGGGGLLPTSLRTILVIVLCMMIYCSIFLKQIKTTK